MTAKLEPTLGIDRAPEGLLVTADGAVFRGRSVGSEGITTGEVVFNTSMTGYQEILTDPSYAGQVVVMTVPHIGNYGVSALDEQADRPMAAGFVMRSMSRRHSNWRSEGSLAQYLARHDVVALSDIDTRRLTRHIRERGAMPIAMGAGVSERELREAAEGAPSMEGLDLASGVSTEEPYRRKAGGDSRGLIVAIDLGMKRDIIDNLTARPPQRSSSSLRPVCSCRTVPATPNRSIRPLRRCVTCSARFPCSGSVSATRCWGSRWA